MSLPDLYERIDYSDARFFDYHRAATGRAREPYEGWIERVHHINGWRGVVHYAAESIIVARSHNSYELADMDDWRSAWDICEAAARTDREHLALMNIATVLAQQDTRYWGIEDPAQESYCSRCEQPRPVEMFETTAHVCEECL